MRAKLFFFCACLLAGGLGGYAFSTHRAIASARTVYFKTVPADPRALLTGDYMLLSYEVEGSRWGHKQPLTVYIGPDNIARKEGPGEPLVIQASALRYRLPHQFYFQEGTGKQYENAAYAQMALLPNGSFLIKALTDENLQPLGGKK